MKNKIALLLALTLIGCNTLKPIKTEYKLIKTFDVDINEYGNGKILIYNGAGIFHKADNTESVNVWIDGRALAKLESNEFLVLYLIPNKYNFKILHKDSGNIETNHEIIIDNKTSVINIKPTFTSNKIEITNKLPKDFKKFKNILDKPL